MRSIEAARDHLETATETTDPAERLYNLRQARQLLIASELEIQDEPRIPL